MKKTFYIVSMILALLFLPLTNSFANDWGDILSQKDSKEVLETLSTELEKIFQEDLEEPSKKACSGEVDLIVVDKQNNKMSLYDDTNCIVKEYSVRLGVNFGPKQFEGDKKTPEGLYRINNKYPSGKYGKFLSISYPTLAQRRYAAGKGFSAGGAVGIHFFASEKSRGSLGCITVKSQEEMNEIYELVKVGTVIKILPDRKK